MRCWVTAIATPDRRDQLHEAQWICEDTHPDPTCVASCQSVVESMTSLIRGQPVDESVLVAISIAGHSSDVVARKISGSDCLPWDRWTNSGWTVGTIESAFAALQQSTSFEEGLTSIVNRGNDADTVGAVAGALLGARFGYNSIPKRWLSKLEKADILVHCAMELQKLRRKRYRVR